MATGIRTVRPERTLEGYSRGAELRKAIDTMRAGFTARTSNGEINSAIEALLTEYDLTLDEWYYWSEACMREKRKTL